jgi:hypothetical protein
MGPLLIIGAALAAAVGFYFYNSQTMQGAAVTNTPGYDVRNVGPIPGTVTPGSTLPSVAASGQAPNTSAALISTAGGAGVGFASMAASTAGITAMGAAVVGIGAIVGVGLALWMAHLARVKGAKDENAVLNTLVPNFSKCLVAEFAALNQGQVSATQALQDLEQIRATYWTAIAPYQKGPGQHTHPCVPLSSTPDPRSTAGWAPGCSPMASCSGATCKATTVCDASCTAGCCIGCDWIEPIICTAKTIIMQGGGMLKIPPAGGSKYGFAGSPAYVLQFGTVQ